MKLHKLTRCCMLLMMAVSVCGNQSHAYGQREELLTLRQSTEDPAQEKTEQKWRDGWCYRELEDGTLELTGYDPNAVGVTKEGLLTIPGELEGKRVDLVSVEFSGDLNLVTVVFEGGVTKVTGNFSRCNKLEKVVFPDTLKELGTGTFYACPALKEAVLPVGLVKTGDCVFSYCTALESIRIPESMTKLESYTFEGCSSLRRVVIPDSVGSVLYCAFKECTALQEVYLPSSLYWLDPHTFFETGNAGEKLKVILPATVKKQKQDWTSMDNLEHLSFYVEEGSDMETYMHQFLDLDVRTYVRDEAFEQAKAQAAGLVETTTGQPEAETMESSGPEKATTEALTGQTESGTTESSGPEKATTEAPAGQTESGTTESSGSEKATTEAPAGQPEAETTERPGPEKATTEAPAGQPEAETTERPEPEKATTEAPTGQTEAGTTENAGRGTAVTEAQVGQTKTEDRAETRTSTQEQPEVGTSTGKEVPATGGIYEAGGLNYKVVSGKQVTVKGVKNKKLRKTVIPARVKLMGKTFQVTGIENGAFKGCGRLKTVTVGDYVRRIGDRAFMNCASLQKITIGKRVKELGKKVFYGDRKLEKIAFQGKIVKKIGKSSFYKVPYTANIYAPKKVKKQYEELIRQTL